MFLYEVPKQASAATFINNLFRHHGIRWLHAAQKCVLIMAGRICITVWGEERKYLSKLAASLKPQDRLKSITLFVSRIDKPGMKSAKKYFDNHKRFHSVVRL